MHDLQDQEILPPAEFFCFLRHPRVLDVTAGRYRVAHRRGDVSIFRCKQSAMQAWEPRATAPQRPAVCLLLACPNEAVAICNPSRLSSPSGSVQVVHVMVGKLVSRTSSTHTIEKGGRGHHTTPSSPTNEVPRKSAAYHSSMAHRLVKGQHRVGPFPNATSLCRHTMN